MSATRLLPARWLFGLRVTGARLWLGALVLSTQGAYADRLTPQSDIEAQGALQVLVHASLSPPAPVYAGQRLSLSVEVLSNALSFADLRIQLPTVAGAVLLEDAVASSRGQVQRQGQDWQRIQYRYPLFLQHPGAFVVPSVTVSGSVREGAAERAFSLQTEPLRTHAQSAPRDGGPVPVVARDLRLDLRLEPVEQPLRVADVITLELVQRAEDLPGLLLPDLSLPPIPGTQMFAAQTSVSTQTRRGQLFGERRTRIAMRVQRPGPLQIPALEAAWFDPLQQVYHRVQTQSVDLQVAPTYSPDQNIHDQTLQDQTLQDRVTAGAVVAAVLGATLLCALVLRRRHSRLRADPVWVAWHALCQHCRRGEALAACDAAWRCESCWPQAERTAIEVELLGAQQAAIAGRPWDGRPLLHLLGRVPPRKRVGAALPPLNPR